MEIRNFNKKSLLRCSSLASNSSKIIRIAEETSNTKFLAASLLLVLLIGVLIVFPTIYCLLNGDLIHCTGDIGFIADSGSVADIQAAVDAAEAAGGGTVYIPAGAWVFDAASSHRVEIPGGVNVFGVGKNETILDLPDVVTGSRSTMFSVVGTNGRPVRISNITFIGRSNTEQADTAVQIQSCKDFRVDHCSFNEMGGVGVSVYDCHIMYNNPKDLSKVSQGLIDHCDFVDIYRPEADPHIGADPNLGGYAYGVAVARSYHYQYTPWEDAWNLFGKYLRNTFIEDCYFSGCRHAVVGNFAGAYVLRSSIIEDIKSQPWAECATTGHPVRENVYGMLSAEIYNCTIRKTGTKDLLNSRNEMYGIHHESGSGLYYNNVLEDLLQALRVGNAEYAGNPFYPEGNTKETYIWNNQITNCEEDYHVFGNSPTGAPAPVEGVDWFRNPPPDERNYTPYQYPHPLAIESP